MCGANVFSRATVNAISVWKRYKALSAAVAKASATHTTRQLAGHGKLAIQPITATRSRTAGSPRCQALPTPERVQRRQSVPASQRGDAE